MLYQIERGALALEDSLGFSADLGDYVTVFELVAVVLEYFCLNVAGLQNLKNSECKLKSAEDAVAFCQKSCGVLLVVVNKIVGRRVKVIDVLK